MPSNGFVAKETVFYKWGSSPLDEINDVGFLKQVCTGTGIKARKFFWTCVLSADNETAVESNQVESLTKILK